MFVHVTTYHSQSRFLLILSGSLPLGLQLCQMINAKVKQFSFLTRQEEQLTVVRTKQVIMTSSDLSLLLERASKHVSTNAGSTIGLEINGTEEGLTTLVPEITAKFQAENVVIHYEAEKDVAEYEMELFFDKFQ